ncbi:MAG: hypothetical protein KG003_15465 [Bacteroidetes bacterium]|nr:hypothetical protein [Bacteroidota bacterium]
MYEIKADELKVLKCMVHAETLDSVITETGLSGNVVIDIVKHLRHYRYVKPVDENGREVSMFEADKIRRVRFILTAKGFTELEKQPRNSDS